jgi:saccharopine dehydrogenase-like NADP-dependent oxidoreductase
LIQRVLIIGGYGNFGSFIAKTLAKDSDLQIIIAGRSLQKAQAFSEKIEAINKVEAYQVDIQNDITTALCSIKPDIVIHTSGPFQNQGYAVAEACINAGMHYIDLADGRDFVANIHHLETLAKNKNVLVISGASSVPCLTSALIDHYQTRFKSIDCLDYGITTAQKTARGLATTAAILSYTGKSFETIYRGKRKQILGWQGLKARKYNQLGWRLLGNCDVPDLALFPVRYPDIKTIRFYAGLEIPLIHLTLWGLSWLVRAGILRRLENFAPLLLKVSYLFDWLGSSNSAFHMTLTGKDDLNLNKKIQFELTAQSGDGPYIPCMPAILLTRKLVQKTIIERGAFPCMGFITYEEYLDSLKDLDISWIEQIS